MKKHYVCVARGGKTVADAFIEADTESGALKLALRGEGINLPELEPDASYTVTCGDACASSFGDEFDRTADFSGDDKPNMDGSGFGGHHTEVWPVPIDPEEEKQQRAMDKARHGGYLQSAVESTVGVDPAIYRGFVPVGFPVRDDDCIMSEEDIQKAREDFINQHLNGSGIGGRRTGVWPGFPPLDFIAHKVFPKECAQNPEEEKQLRADDFGSPISHSPREPITTPAMLEVDFTFRCECGHEQDEHRTIPDDSQTSREWFVRCNACGTHGKVCYK